MFIRLLTVLLIVFHLSGCEEEPKTNSKINLNPEKPTLSYQQAGVNLENLIVQFRYSDALELVEEYARMWPEDDYLQSYKSHALYELGRIDEAKKISLQIANFSNEDSERSFAFSLLSNIELHNGNQIKALEYANIAEAIAPTSSTKLSLGFVLFTEGKYEEAIKKYEEAIELELLPTDQQTRPAYNFIINFLQRNIALSYLKLGQSEKGEEIIRKLVANRQKCESFPDLYAFLGDINLAIKELNIGLSCYDSETSRFFLKDMEKDLFNSYVKIKNNSRWKAEIKKWTEKLN